jgi:4-hydroxybenzoate polyprenyltransferase
MSPSALRTALRLGRVSNLPTVWTNVLAGLALAGGPLAPGRVALLGLATSLFYVAGMYLNDAFDRHWDARHRPDRPIPAGEVSAAAVFLAGFAMLGGGLALLALGLPTRPPLYAGLILTALIVVYDFSHKENPLAAVVMALCRVSVYAISALSVAAPPPLPVYLGALALLAYLVVLTTLARKETRRPGLRKVIGALIAGICFLDGAMLLLTGHTLAAAAAVGAFFLTRRLQRSVPGT